MSCLARIQTVLRERYPFLACYSILIALIVVVPQPAVSRNFYYVFLLAPFALSLNCDDFRRLSRSWVLWAAIIYVVTLLVSYFLNIPREPAQFIGIIRHLSLGLAFAAITAWIFSRNSRHLETFIHGLAWILPVFAMYSLWSFYSTHPLSERFVAGHWSNPNTSGTIFGLAAVLIIGALPLARTNLPRLVMLLTALLIALGGVVLAGTRSAFLAFAASVLICFFLLRSWKSFLWVLVPLVLIVVSAILFDPTDLVLKVTRTGDGGRSEIWAHYFHLAGTRWWAGHGIQNEFQYGYQIQGVILDSPHNMAIEALLYGGVLAAVAYVALVASMLFAGYVYLQRTRIMAPLAISLYVTIHGLFESILPISSADWRWIYFWMPIGIVAAAEAILTKTSGPPLSKSESKKPPVKNG
jgi:O-antigen ligase